jgi:hypothetical protein
VVKNTFRGVLADFYLEMGFVAQGQEYSPDRRSGELELLNVQGAPGKS